MGKKDKKHSKADRAKERYDGWQSAATGIGVIQKDKRLSTTFSVDTLSQRDIEAIWRGDDMAARAIERLPRDMLRAGFEVKIADEKPTEQKPGEPGELDDQDPAQLKKERRDAFPPMLAETPKQPPKPIKPKDGRAREQCKLLKAKLDDLKVHERFRKALEYARAYGGSAILVGANDGSRDLTRPLNFDGIKDVTFLTTLSAFELYPVSWYNDPLKPNYGEPEIYEIQPITYFSSTRNNVPRTGVRVHESRLIIFPGIETSRHAKQSNNPPGWGDSVLVRLNRVLSDFHLSWGSAAILIADFAQAVIKIEGLAELYATNNEEVLLERARAIDYQRSTARAILLDAEEEFERKSTSVTGLEGLLQQLAIRLSAAADMPVTILFGQSPAGMNATGESDFRNWYDNVASEQKNSLKPRLEYLIKMIFRAKDGPTKGVEPESWDVVFNPLWQPTDKEKAETRHLQAQTDQIYINASVVTPEEIAISRFGGDVYSLETVVDFEGREDLQAEYEEKKAAFEEEKKAAFDS